MKPAAPSARASALHLLDAVLHARRTLDEALAAAPLRGLDADNKFTMLLVLTVLRHLGQLDTVIARYLDKPLPAKRRIITNALRLGLAQLLLLETPAHAAVNETVTLVKKSKDGGLAGLVNAVLQKAARERPALPSAAYNLPAWLAARWTRDYGADHAAAMTRVAAMRPPLDLSTTADIMESTRLDAQTVRLPADHAPVEQLAGYGDGAFFVQDIAASYPARLLGDVRGLRILDIGAAPGGKTAQLARAGAIVTALDRSPARLERLRENMQRLKYEVETIAADMTVWEAPEPYDAILLDAPCSATGTWRRHPEVVHIVTPADIAELASLQRTMLTRAWAALKPGGKLVYCVCSLEREEGEAQAEWFLSEYKDASVQPIPTDAEIPVECITPQHYLRTLPGYMEEKGGMDGFFAVCFVKA